MFKKTTKIVLSLVMVCLVLVGLAGAYEYDSGITPEANYYAAADEYATLIETEGSINSAAGWSWCAENKYFAEEAIESAEDSAALCEDSGHDLSEIDDELDSIKDTKYEEDLKFGEVGDNLNNVPKDYTAIGYQEAGLDEHWNAVQLADEAEGRSGDSRQEYFGFACATMTLACGYMDTAGEKYYDATIVYLAVDSEADAVAVDYENHFETHEVP